MVASIDTACQACFWLFGCHTPGMGCLHLQHGCTIPSRCHPATRTAARCGPRTCLSAASPRT